MSDAASNSSPEAAGRPSEEAGPTVKSPDGTGDSKTPVLGQPAKPRNALTHLMSAHPTTTSSPPSKPKPKPHKKRKPPSSPPHLSPNPAHYTGRHALGLYLLPNARTLLPPAQAANIIYQTPDFVALHDLYPKGTIHTLLLPRDVRMTLEHPIAALDGNAGFRERVRQEAEKLRRVVAAELRRQFGRESAMEGERQRVLDGGTETEAEAVLPPGRDWLAEVKVGIHAGPSMSHLHVHVLSREMHGAALQHRRHYNSFNTPFLVDLAEFPLAANDTRRTSEGKAALLRRPLTCWRCGRCFDDRFAQFTRHLDEEFEAWKKE